VRCAWESNGQVIDRIVAHLDTHRKADNALRLRLKRAFRKTRAKERPSRLAAQAPVPLPDDDVFKSRMDAFIQRGAEVSPARLLSRLCAPAAYAAPLLPAVHRGVVAGAVYKESAESALCVLRTKDDFEAVFVIPFRLQASCRKHPGLQCWRCEPDSKTKWLKYSDITDLPRVLTTPRFRSNQELKRASRFVCFKVSAPRRCEAGAASNAERTIGVLRPTGAPLDAHDARALATFIPSRTAWYQHPDRTPLRPDRLKCTKCLQQSPLRFNGTKRLRSLGLGLGCLFEVLVPTLRCDACGYACAATHTSIRMQLPPDVGSIHQWDRVGRRFLDVSVTDFICAELRARFHRGVVKSKYVGLLRTFVDGSGLVGLAGCSELAKSMAHATIIQSLPATRWFCNVALLVFQQIERPRVPAEIQAVCSVFGVVIMADGSGGPLAEVRQYPTADVDKALLPRTGAALIPLGLFNVPLTPYIAAAEENGVISMQMVAWVMHQCASTDPGLSPCGYVDDNAEHMWNLFAHLLEKSCRALVLSGVIKIDREAKRIEGFLRGIDVIHVLWRLTSNLLSGSHDFLSAALTLRKPRGR
jgi:hypothetical protein